MGCVNGKESRARKYAVSRDEEADAQQGGKAVDATTQSPSSPAAKSDKAAAPSGNIVNFPRPKLDPKDFQFVNGKNEVKIKPPGSINGQSFMIDKCENCDIYILDHCGQVTMDDCKDCRVYIGPTDGAVFVRDCTSCNLAVVCRQLRTRDCSDCKFALYCRTKPIVESSSNLGFSCLDLSYPELREHMQHAKLGPFHNFWYDIFDFTPKDGNWRLLPGGTSSAALLEPIPPEAAERLTLMRSGGQQQQQQEEGEEGEVEKQEEVEKHHEKQQGEATSSDQSPLLLTLGSGGPPPASGGGGQSTSSYMFVAFDGAKQSQALQLARSAANKGWLLRTNEVRLTAPLAAALAAEAGWSKSVGKALSAASGAAGCVGLELTIPAEEVAAAEGEAGKLGGHVSGREAAGATFRTAGLEG